MTSAPTISRACERLAEEEMPEQDGGHRNEQRHQHHVAGARAHQDLEEHHIGERSRQRGGGQEGEPGPQARGGQKPGPLDRRRRGRASRRSSRSAGRSPRSAAGCRRAGAGPTGRRIRSSRRRPGRAACRASRPPARSRPWPRRMITPTRPARTPTTRRAASGSSPAAAITRTVNSGVVALSTEASPLAIRVWPETMSENGMTLLRSPITRNGIQPAQARGQPRPAGPQHRQQQDGRDRHPGEHDGERRQLARPRCR